MAIKCKLIEHTDSHMTRKRIGFPRTNFFYPSEASVRYRDESGDSRVEGTCLRASYYRMTGVPSAPPDAYSEWIFSLGKGVEEILVEQWKQMGIWVANNVKFFDKDHCVSGEIDVLLTEPGGSRIFGVECLTPDSLIMTGDYRTFPIGKLLEYSREKENFSLLGDDGSSQIIQNLQIKEVDTEVYRFRGKFDGLPTWFTGNHPIQVATVKVSRLKEDNKQRSYRVLSTYFKDAERISRGDYVCIPKAKFTGHWTCFQEVVSPKQWPYQLKDDRVYSLSKNAFTQEKGLPAYIKPENMGAFHQIIGLYIAEGSCSNNTVYWSLHQDETLLIETLRFALKDMFDLDLVVRKMGDSKCVNVSVTSKAFRELIKTIVPGNSVQRTKHVRYDLIYRQYIDAVLHGIYQGDGCIVATDQCRITTCVPDLAYLYFQLAAHMGLSPNIKKHQQMSQLDSDHIYAVCWSDNLTKRNQEKLIDGGDFWSYKVKFIETKPYKGKVYNLECNSRNTFTAGLIATHNCKSFYGHYATKEICGSKRPPKKGKPKDAHLLQALLYVDLCKRHKILDYFKLVYYARDSAARTEFDIEIIEDNGLKRPMINGVIDYRFTVDEIYDRYEELQNYLERDEVPPPDFELRYDAEKIEKRYKTNDVSKTAYEAWRKNPDKNPIGDWQCKYCAFKHHCWNTSK